MKIMKENISMKVAKSLKYIKSIASVMKSVGICIYVSALALKARLREAMKKHIESISSENQ